ncbi:MAG: hypothetical protein KDF67_21270, partial [Ottowia sp.]|nr:hypothetical protein [Ottowia sp.]
MNPSGHPPGGPPMDDDLLARYQEAAELDAAQPDPNVRAAVLAEAQMQAWRHAEGMDAAGGTDEPPPTAPGDPASHLRLIETRALPRPPTRPAANDHRWPIRAVASVAVLGLAGLLALQFGRSPQTEQDVGLGRSAPSAQEGTVSDSGQVADAPAPTPSAQATAAEPQTPSAMTAPAPAAAPGLAPAAERQPGATTAAPAPAAPRQPESEPAPAPAPAPLAESNAPAAPPPAPQKPAAPPRAEGRAERRSEPAKSAPATAPAAQPTHDGEAARTHADGAPPEAVSEARAKAGMPTPSAAAPA